MLSDAWQKGGRAGLDLGRLPVTSLQEVDDPRQLVLHPDFGTIGRYGEPALGARMTWARLTGRTAALNRTIIDPTYKPIHWLLADGVPIGSSATDLDRLAELGRVWLEHAGVRPGDVVVSVVTPGPDLGFWELVLATRRAGLSTIFLPADTAAADVTRLRPTVLAGAPADLARLLTEADGDPGLDGVTTVLAMGEPLDEERRDGLEAAIPDGAVVLAAWAPAGCRSLWAECRTGIGLHTSSEADVVEVTGGEVLWTALGWSGSVLVRLRTGVAGQLDDRPCPGCGRAGARVITDDTGQSRARSRTTTTTKAAPPRARVRTAAVAQQAQTNGDFAAVLDGHAGVAAWQAELRTVAGVEELIVFLGTEGDAHPGPVLRDLIGQVDAVQYVVLPTADVEDRVHRLDGRRVVDLRE
jgi:hypothetical protein